MLVYLTFIIAVSGAVLAQLPTSPEQNLPGIIDSLWDKINKSDSSLLTREEFENFFSQWDTDINGGSWSLDEAEFVAGWGPLFEQEANEAAAFFRAFDWQVKFLSTECRVDALDIEEIVDTIGILGFVTEEAFKQFLKEYFKGHAFAIVFMDYRTVGTGQYDDVITLDEWFSKFGAAIDYDNSTTLLIDEWTTFFSPTYLTLQTSTLAFSYVDFDASLFIDETEWEIFFYYMKLIFEYPETEQLHFEEWMQFEGLVLDTPRP